MSELSINDLPREMLIKVFRYLEVVNLKNAALSCKLWNNLIESAHQWSLELIYVACGKLIMKEAQDNDQKINFVLTTNRKFGTIQITNGRLSEDSQILQIFQRHGRNVVKLILHDCHFNSLASIAELLNLTSNLKHADIRTKFLCDVSNVPLDHILPDLKQLKYLDLSLYDQRIIKCFRKAKVTTITIWEHERSERYAPLLVDFLSSQEMLTSMMAFTAYARFPLSSDLAQLGKLDVTFRLTQLAIAGIAYGDPNDDENLLRFMESQAKHLTVVDMGFFIPRYVYKCEFAMTKLKTLSLAIHDIPRDQEFYDRLEENRSVRTLTLLNSYGSISDDIQHVGNLLKKLPNIHSLNLMGFGNAKNLVMAQNLRNVESLSIREMDERSFDCVKFPNLKTLHIEYLRANVNWNDFTKIHPKLAELTIETMKAPVFINNDISHYDKTSISVETMKESSSIHNIDEFIGLRKEKQSFFSTEDIDQITTNVRLQCLRLGIGFVADDRFFNILFAKCANLKVLDLHKSCLSDGLRNKVKINVLRLCDKIKCLEHTYTSIPFYNVCIQKH